IAGLKDNKYFPNPPADPATLEANHNIRGDCDCLLHKCRCSRLEWCSCIDDRIACANHTANGAESSTSSLRSPPGRCDAARGAYPSARRIRTTADPKKPRAPATMIRFTEFC